MISRSLLATVAVVLTVVSSGVAFAAFSSSVGLSVSGSAGSLDLVFTYIALGAGTPSYISISSEVPAVPPTAGGSPASIVTLDLGPFGVGDTSVIDFTVKNLGTLPAGPPLTVHAPGPGSSECDSEWSSSSPTGVPSSLGGGASFSGTWSITFTGPTLGCPTPSTAVFVLVISGSA